MMKRRSNGYGRATSAAETASSRKERVVAWEMRPCGMLVQKRDDVGEGAMVPSVPNLRLRISYGALRYEISVNSLATFGEVKKLLTAETGLQPGEQKLVYRGRERDNGDYLDTCGVKDRSKVVLIEDPCSIEKRHVEMRKTARIQAAQRAISNVSLEVDRLADQVSAIEKSISDGVKVPEVQVTTLIEMLMRQAVKLDEISVEGDVSSQKILQSKRVQKCVETLDVLKVSNERGKPVVVTTKWETFDHSISTTSTSRWEYFD